MARNATPTPQSVWSDYEKGLAFNNRISLDDTIEANENFFIGKQWEGVESNGLPTPVFNFLKRVTLFQVASITTDNIKLHSSVMGNLLSKEAVRRATDVVNAEFDVLFERNKIVSAMREYARNAAVDGDGCTYTYWDDSVDTGLPQKGAIVTEILSNDSVFFGDPNERSVQKQPSIVIATREFVDDVIERAKKSGTANTEAIVSDSKNHGDSRFEVDGKVTVLLRLARKNDGHIWAFESTRSCPIRKEWDTGLTLYPITWLCWDYVKNCYHGQAMTTGLIPNQIFVNKMYAMSMLSLMSSAYPKTLYDKTRISKWSNQVGGAIGVAGGDINAAAKILEPAQISPQVSQFIDKAVEHTQTFLGATSAALGDTRPDNTSAIIALQRAAAVPSEITKQNLYQSIEELGLIYVDHMAAFYGRRTIELPAPKDVTPQVLNMAGMSPNDTIPTEFDFSELRKMPMSLKLDVGASSYWSEIASIQTLDNLLGTGKIDIVDYLERMPNGYIKDQTELKNKYEQLTATMMPGAGGAPTDGVGVALPERPDKTEQLPMTAGNAQLQRKIAEQGMA